MGFRRNWLPWNLVDVQNTIVRAKDSSKPTCYTLSPLPPFETVIQMECTCIPLHYGFKTYFLREKKMRNTILICYCCFNLRLLSILAHFAQTFYSILFLSYGIVRAFVYVCRYIRTLTQREIEEKKKEFYSFHSSEIDATD